MSSQRDTGTTFDAQVARIAVGAYDDAQDQRTAMMNRIRDLVRKRNEGIPFDEVEEEKDDDDYDSKYKDENLADIIEEMVAEDRLDDREFEYLQMMLDAAEAAIDVEERAKSVMEIVEREPIYDEWLQHVNGIGTTLAARLLHRYGYCDDFEKVSNLWSYSGLAPGQERRRGEQLNYDPEARTLAWLCADRMIMQGDRSDYKTEFYDPYKAKQVDRMEQVEGRETEVRVIQRENGEGTVPATFDLETGEMLFTGTAPDSDGHAHARASRYLSKKFLKHYWAIARDMRGLETPAEWIVTHGGHEEREDTFENPWYAKRQVIGPDA